MGRVQLDFKKNEDDENSPLPDQTPKDILHIPEFRVLTKAEIDGSIFEVQIIKLLEFENQISVR